MSTKKTNARKSGCAWVSAYGFDFCDEKSVPDDDDGGSDVTTTTSAVATGEETTADPALTGGGGGGSGGGGAGTWVQQETRYRRLHLRRIWANH